MTTEFITVRADSVRVANPAGGYDTLHCEGAHTFTLPLGPNISFIQDLFNEEDPGLPVKVFLGTGASFDVFPEDVSKLRAALKSTMTTVETQVPMKAKDSALNRLLNNGSIDSDLRKKLQGKPKTKAKKAVTRAKKGPVGKKGGPPAKGTMFARLLDYFKANDTRNQPHNWVEIAKTVKYNRPSYLHGICRDLANRGLLVKGEFNGRVNYWATNHTHEIKSSTPPPASIDWNGRLFTAGSPSIQNRFLIIARSVALAKETTHCTLSFNRVNRLLGDSWIIGSLRSGLSLLKRDKVLAHVQTVSQGDDYRIDITLRESYLYALTEDQKAFGELLAETPVFAPIPGYSTSQGNETL